MKPCSPALRALMATRGFKFCNLFTITLVDGTALRYTDADIDISASGFTYKCGGHTGPFFNHKWKWKASTSVEGGD